MSVQIREKILDLKNCLNIENFSIFKECEEDEISLLEDYFKVRMSTIGLYASVHPTEYLENKDLFYSIVLDLEKELKFLQERKQQEGDIIEGTPLNDNPTNSELLASSYGTALYLFCAIDTMREGKFNFNYFKGKYPKTTLRTVPLNCFNSFDVKLSVACETDKKLYDNFVENNLSVKDKEFIIETLDSFNIRGPELRMLVRAICGNNFKKVLTLCNLLKEENPNCETIQDLLIKNINQNQTVHSTFKVSKLSKIDGVFLDTTRPILTKLDCIKQPEPLLYFSDYLDKLPFNTRLQLNFIKPFLDENNNPIKLNEKEITDFDIRAIFTTSEIENLENLLKDQTQFNLYLSRLCLELRNFMPTSVTPIILDKINSGKNNSQNINFKKKIKTYELQDSSISILDYIEANNLKPNTKLFLVKNVLNLGKNKIENILQTFIENKILCDKTDKILTQTSCFNIDTLNKICDAINNRTVLGEEILRSVNSSNDYRTLDEIEQDLKHSKMDLNTLSLQLDNERKLKESEETIKNGENSILQSENTSTEEEINNQINEIFIKEANNSISNDASINLDLTPEEELLLKKYEAQQNNNFTSNELGLNYIEENNANLLNTKNDIAFVNDTTTDSEYGEAKSPIVNNNFENISQENENGEKQIINKENIAKYNEENSEETNEENSEETNEETFEENKSDILKNKSLNLEEYALQNSEIKTSQPGKELESLNKQKDVLGNENLEDTTLNFKGILGEDYLETEINDDTLSEQDVQNEENQYKDNIKGFENDQSENLKTTSQKDNIENINFSNQNEISTEINTPLKKEQQSTLKTTNEEELDEATKAKLIERNNALKLKNLDDNSPFKNQFGMAFNNMPNAMNNPNGFIPYFNPYFTPYPNIMPDQMQQMNQPSVSNQNQTSYQNNLNGVNQNNPNGMPAYTNMYPYGYPYPMYPNMMNPMFYNGPNMPQQNIQSNMNIMSQNNGTTPNSSNSTQQLNNGFDNNKQINNTKSQENKSAKTESNTKQFVSRSQKLENAFFKDLDSSNQNQKADLTENNQMAEIKKTKEVPLVTNTPTTNENGSLGGESVGMSEADFFADLGGSTSSGDTDPDNL